MNSLEVETRTESIATNQEIPLGLVLFLYLVVHRRTLLFLTALGISPGHAVTAIKSPINRHVSEIEGCWISINGDATKIAKMLYAQNSSDFLRRK